MINKEKLEAVLQKFIEERSLRGLAVEVATEQTSLLSYSDLKPEAYPVYSITKSVIATLILKSAEEGKLSLKDSLAIFFPQLLPVWLGAKTIWDLLCHRSGLADYGYLPEYKDRLKKEPNHAPLPAELKRMVYEQGPKVPEQNPFFYSNVGYLLLVEILESVYTKSFAEIVQQRIFGPLKLHNTRVLTTLEDIQNMVPGYSPGWVAHKLIASTTSDLNRFFKAVFSGEILNAHSLSLIHKPYKLPFQHKWYHPSYGPGFLGDVDSKWGSILGHNGGGPGYNTSSYCWENKGTRVYLSAAVAKDTDTSAEDLLLTLISCSADAKF